MSQMMERLRGLARQNAERISRTSQLEPRVKHLLPLASGKGGVGKTTMAVYGSIILSEFGETVLVDLDPLPDSDIFLGPFPEPVTSIDDVISGRSPMSNAILKTNYTNLSMMTGGVREGTPDRFAQTLPLLQMIPADYVLLDLGAGWEHAGFVAQFNAFVLVCDVSAAALRDAETYLKAVAYSRWAEISGMSEEIKEEEQSDFLNGKLSLESLNVRSRGEFKDSLREMSVYVIVNRSDDPRDAERMNSKLNEWRAVIPNITVAGYVPADPDIARAAREGRLVLPVPAGVRSPLQTAFHDMFSTPLFLSDRNFWSRIWEGLWDGVTP